MKKKIFAITYSLLLMVNLTACAGETDVIELQKRVTCLENRVQALENAKTEISDFNTESTNIETYAETTDRTDSSEEIVDIIAYLDKQIELKDSSSMLEVARCEQATESHLISAAQYCIDYGYSTTAIDIAEEVLNNPNCTKNVAMKFSEASSSTLVSLGHEWIEN